MLEVSSAFEAQMSKLFKEENHTQASVIQSAFFDFRENGTMDLFMVLKSAEKTSIHAIFNNYGSDNFFLRYYGQNGALASAQGAPYHGSSFMSEIANAEGQVFTAHGRVCIQSINCTKPRTPPWSCPMPSKAWDA